MSKRANPRLVIPQHAQKSGALVGTTWGASGSIVHIGVVDHQTDGDVYMPSTQVAPHLSLVLLVEGQGHFLMGGKTTPCEFLSGHCFLSCGWEPFDAEDFVPAHARFRAVMLRFPLDLRAMVALPVPRPDCEVHAHPSARAWLARLPMPDALIAYAQALVENGLPSDPLDLLHAQCQGLQAFHTVAAYISMLTEKPVMSGGTNPSNEASVLSLTGRDRRSLLAARRHIESHLDQPLRLAGVATVAGMSETALKQGFRSFFGTSVYEYVLTARCHRAADLLRNGALTIQHVAERCGFANTSHLAKHFRQRFTLTPLQYRMQHR